MMIAHLTSGYLAGTAVEAAHRTRVNEHVRTSRRLLGTGWNHRVETDVACHIALFVAKRAKPTPCCWTALDLGKVRPSRGKVGQSLTVVVRFSPAHHAMKPSLMNSFPTLDQYNAVSYGALNRDPP